jgi:hypothetical protein
VRKLYVPYLSCASILEPLEFHHIEYSFYQLSEEMEIEAPPVLDADERLLYIDYFGIKSAYDRPGWDRGGSLVSTIHQVLYAVKRPTFGSPQIPRRGGYSIPAPLDVIVLTHRRSTSPYWPIVDGPRLH